MSMELDLNNTLVIELTDEDLEALKATALEHYRTTNLEASYLVHEALMRATTPLRTVSDWTRDVRT